MENSTKHVHWEPINFATYLSFIKWWVLLAVVGELVLRNILDKYVSDLSLQEIVIWLWRFLILGFLGWRTVKSYGPVPQIGILAGTLMGFIIGLVVSLSRFMDGFKIWKVFNIITETILTTLVAALFVFLIVYIFKLIKR